MSIISSVQRLVTLAQSQASELATVKQQLADALADDAADDEAIAAAQAEADEAKAKLPELQALADLDTKEDAEVEALIASVLPAEEPNI